MNDIFLMRSSNEVEEFRELMSVVTEGQRGYLFRRAVSSHYTVFTRAPHR